MKLSRRSIVTLGITVTTSVVTMQILDPIKSPQPEFRMLTRYKISRDRLEPTSYGDSSELEYVSYLYSSLAQYDNQGQIVSALSEKFFWEENDLVFEIRKDAKSSKGDLITAQDVLFNFKRHHILLPNHASQLFSEVCDGKTLKKIDDTCPGLIAHGNKFIVRFKIKKPLYINLFASPDFAIVPMNAIDKNSLKVLDFHNNTGPYRLIEANEKESFLKLEARKEHWLWKEEIPQKVLIKTFFDQDGKEPSNKYMTDLFFEGKFDIVSTVAGGRPALFKIIDDDLKGYNVFRSLPISTYIIFFSDRARKEFSEEERLRIGELYREAYYKHTHLFSHPAGAIQTKEFFPPSSEGELTQEQKTKYETLVAKAKLTKLHHPAVLHVIESYMKDNVQYITEAGPELTYQDDEAYNYPPDKSFHKRFDGFFSLINASSIEGADSIFWIKAMDWMPYSPDESDRWIRNYLETEDKAARVAMTKSLHFDMLTKGIVAPIKAQEYVAVAQKPWKLKFSKLFSATPLWQIEYEP